MYSLPMPCKRPASMAVSGFTLLKRRATACDMAATAALLFQCSSRGCSKPLRLSTFFSCDMAKAIAALRTMLWPMRLMAVRSSVIALPVKLRAAELAICIRRAARAGPEPTTRLTWSWLTFSSANTLRTRRAMSGKLGRSTLPRESSEASARTKAKASVSTADFGACAAAVFISIPRGSAASYPPSTRGLSPVTGSRLLRAACDIHGFSQGEYLSRDVFESQNVLRGAQCDRFAGHSPYHARRLILCDGAAAGVQHLFQSLRTVFPHARENDTDGIASGVLCNGAK